jgi:hypothetical protein
MYAIRCLKQTQNGFITETLGKDSQWYIACNGAGFKTLSEARIFFKNSNHALRGSSIWIEGPRGGRHSLFNKK